jgi:two-component system, NarL family, sensor kinase
MSKRSFVLLGAVLAFLAGKPLFGQQSAKDRVIEIVSSASHDSTKAKLLLAEAEKLAPRGDSSMLLFTAAASRLLKSTASQQHTFKLHEIMAVFFLSRSNPDSARKYIYQNLSVAQENQDQKQIAETYLRLAQVDQLQRVYTDASTNQLKSLEYFEKLRDTNGMLRSMDALGSSYTVLNQLGKSVELLNRAIPIAIRFGNKSLLAKLYSTLSSAYADLQKDSLVLHYQKLALGLYKQANDIQGIVVASIGLGMLYEQRKAYAEAEQIYSDAISVSTSNQDLRMLGQLYYNMGVVYYNTGKRELASQMQDSAIKYASISKDQLLLSKVYKQKSMILYDKGDYKGGYEFVRKYTALNDSIYTANMQSTIAAIQTKYESEKHQRRLQEEKFANIKRIYWVVGILIVAAAAALLLISWYKRQKLREERKLHQAIIAQQDLATKAVIEAEENERKRIAGDLHDGVGQMMSAAKMNLSSFESKVVFRSDEEKASFEKIITLVDDSCKEVRNVSHNMMPNALLKAGLASAVKEFIEKIDSRKLKVNLHTEGLNERLDRNIETVLYRVIQECVNNVIKHSGANHLDISLIKDEEGISATIEDNGRGFDIRQKGKFDGIGLKNIETRISYLKGSVDFDSRPGRGTLVAIHVPLS